jgi:hypothetical protein
MGNEFFQPVRVPHNHHGSEAVGEIGTLLRSRGAVMTDSSAFGAGAFQASTEQMPRTAENKVIAVTGENPSRQL